MVLFDPQWYTTADFAGIDAINVFHKENVNFHTTSTIGNYHILTRSVYAYRGGRAVLRITADDYYVLYINGEYICCGPAPSYHNHYYFNEVDITDHLIPGDNIISAHLYYQGLINRVWQSGDNRFGIAAQINGTDLLWRYKVSHAFSGDINGYDTDFCEDFDSRLWDDDWNAATYDDSDWQPMIAVKHDYTFAPQPCDMVSVERISAEKVRFEQGRCFVDIGREIVGHIRLKIRGNAADVVRVRYAEELNADGSLRYNIRAGCRYEDLFTLKDGVSCFENYIYKGFRYVEVIFDGELVELSVFTRHYPFDDDYCRPIFTDDRLAKIFTLCKNTIKYATQDCFIDCPTREKGQYLGDAFIAGHSHALLTGKTDLLEKSVDDFARTSRICSGLMAVAPCSLMQEIADYSLIFGELLLLTYRFNHNKDFLQKYYPVARDVILHFKQYERADGLLDTVSDKWNLVDWPEGMRDGYDFDLSRPIVASGVHNVINAYYIGAIKTLCSIERLLDIPASFDHIGITRAYSDAFVRDGLLVDSEGSAHSSLHSNVYALYFDLVPEDIRDDVIDFIVGKGLSCGVYTGYFLLKALAANGRTDAVRSLLTNDSDHGCLNMIKEGATTCFEVWGREQKSNTSLCHPWATAPVAIILEDLGEDYVISCDK